MKKFIIILIIVITNCALLIGNCYAQWHRIEKGTSSNLTSIKFIDQNTGWLTGDGGSIFKSTNGGNTWSFQNPTQPYAYYYNIGAITNSNHGFITGAGVTEGTNTYLTTSNGGNNWISYPIGSNTYIYNSSFINQNTGYAIFDKSRLIGIKDTISKTTDGGVTWNALYAKKFVGYDIFFTNELTGWICTTDTIFKTTDGGLSWPPIFITSYSNRNYFQKLFFLDSQIGWLGKDKNEYETDTIIYKTNNGGINWAPGLVSSDTLLSISSDIYFADANTGWLNVIGGKLFKTTDGGQNWNVQLTSQFTFRNMNFINSQTGWIVGYHTEYDSTENSECGIYKTTNGGNNWLSQSNKIGSLFSQYFINSSTGFIGDDIGHLYKTTDGGSNWNISLGFHNQILELGYTYGHSFQSLFFINDMTGWVATSDTGIYKTTNQGLNWNYSGFNTGLRDTTIVDMYFINSATGWAIGNPFKPTLFKTINGGANWTKLYEGNTKFFVFNKVSFANQSTGWICGGSQFDNTNLFKTTNGGLNWTDISTTGNQNFELFAMKFINVNTGWVGGYSLGPQAGVLKTTNGGANWNNLLDTVGVICMDFLNESSGWVYGGRLGNIYYTTNGGNIWHIQSSDNMSSINNLSILQDGTGYATGFGGVILKTTNFGGNPIGITQNQNQIPKSFRLFQNYPNPFNPITIIRYEVSRTSEIIIKIYDIIGRELKTLVNKKQSPGLYEIKFDASNYASGIYFYKLQADNQIFEIKKMVLVK